MMDQAENLRNIIKKQNLKNKNTAVFPGGAGEMDVPVLNDPHAPVQYARRGKR